MLMPTMNANGFGGMPNAIPEAPDPVEQRAQLIRRDLMQQRAARDLAERARIHSERMRVAPLHDPEDFVKAVYKKPARTTSGYTQYNPLSTRGGMVARDQLNGRANYQNAAGLNSPANRGNADQQAARAEMLPPNADRMADLHGSLQNGMRKRFAQLAMAAAMQQQQKDPPTLTPDQWRQQNERDMHIASGVEPATPEERAASVFRLHSQQQATRQQRALLDRLAPANHADVLDANRAAYMAKRDAKQNERQLALTIAAKKRAAARSGGEEGDGGAPFMNVASAYFFGGPQAAQAAMEHNRSLYESRASDRRFDRTERRLDRNSADDREQRDQQFAITSKRLDDQLAERKAHNDLMFQQGQITHQELINRNAADDRWHQEGMAQNRDKAKADADTLEAQKRDAFWKQRSAAAERGDQDFIDALDAANPDFAPPKPAGPPAGAGGGAPPPPLNRDEKKAREQTIVNALNAHPDNPYASFKELTQAGTGIGRHEATNIIRQRHAHPLRRYFDPYIAEHPHSWHSKNFLREEPGIADSFFDNFWPSWDWINPEYVDRLNRGLPSFFPKGS